MKQTNPDHYDAFTLDLFNRVEQAEHEEQFAEAVATQSRFHLTSYIIGLLTALILVGGMTLLFRQPEPPPIVIQPPPTIAPTSTALPTATPAPLVVFVSGAVRQPGMYALDATARVGDALTAAGGMTLQANPALVNQAERLWDGAQIHVPGMTVAQPSGSTTDTSNALTEPQQLVGAQAVTLAEPPVGLSGSTVAPAGRSNLGESSTNLVSINYASPDQLTTLPGIGPSKAAAIVANRPYTSIDDLERVPGIGAKTIEQLRSFVTAD